MSDFLSLVLDAHGGLDRWNQLTEVSATAVIGGTAWVLKQQQGFLGETKVTIDPHVQRVNYRPLGENGAGVSYVPDRVAILDKNEIVQEERSDPRNSFDDHVLGTPWDKLHAAYFSGYAMWNYLTIPFLFARPGFEIEEIDPWLENAEEWRRLRVDFPSGVATHCKTQTFYFGPDYLLRRHDYEANVFSGAPIAHYTGEHKSFGGFSFPTRRRAVSRRPDGRSLDVPAAVSIEIHSVSVR